MPHEQSFFDVGTRKLGGEALAPYPPTLLDDFPPRSRRGTGAEAVRFGALALLWLVGSFGHTELISLCTQY